MTEIKPIETVYNGYRFRSRLEARWAVFFDALGVKYEYEPEGFQKGDMYYLPDFRIDCHGCRGIYSSKSFPLYVEVKGKMTEEDKEKIHAFTTLGFAEEERERYWFVPGGDEETPFHLSILVVGDIPDPETYSAQSEDLHSYDMMDGVRIYPWNYETIDGDHFAAYPAVKNGHFYLDGDDCNYTTMDPDVIRRAFKKARQARFEYGETPKQ